MSSKRELRSAGSTTAQNLDSTKTYKYNSSGAIVESTGTPSGTDIVFSGSKSSLRRIADLERNLSILAAKALTDDGSGSGETGDVDYAKKAGQWSTSRTLALTGDVTGTASIDGSGNVSLSTTVAANSVALGTDTTGNYMVNVSAGTGISVSHTQGEGSTATINSTITQYTDTLATAAARAAHSAGAGISYNSSTGAIASTITQYTDALAVSANASAIATAKTEAITAAATDATTKANAAQAAAIAAVTNGAGAAFDTLKEIQDAMATDTELSAAIAAISNVASATKLQTARTISGVAFDGTANITLATSGITESGNLYYTDARARAAHSFTAGSGAYNSTTGVITIPTNTNQLANGAGFITGYTETDTLASVTARGASTSSALSTGALTVSGAITATGEVTAYYSDLRLKTNIVPIADALAKVEAINGVTFDPNAAALALGIDDRHQMGVIAQEIEAVAPELVCDSAFAGYKTVRYDKLTALLIEAVKELSAKVKTLEAQIGTKGEL